MRPFKEGVFHLPLPRIVLAAELGSVSGVRPKEEATSGVTGDDS